MFQSDSDSKDSDEGIRFKTESIRNKKEKLSSKSSYRDRSRSRSPSSRSRRRPRRDRRSPSRERYRKKSDTRKSSKQKDEVVVRRIKEKSKSDGPALSSQFLSKAAQGESRKVEKIETPALVGPALPPHLVKATPEESRKVEKEAIVAPLVTKATQEEKPAVVGPALPPHLREKPSPVEENLDVGPSPQVDEETSSSSGIGPQLPSHLRQKLQEESMANTQLYTNEESDDDVYGPVPTSDLKYSKSQIALEERALELKLNQLEPKEDKAQPREEWMLELPEVKASKLGLGPRQFRSKAGPDMSDRSSWTDTPETKGKAKAEKVDLKKETEIKEIRRRDDEQEKISKKHKVKNKESLLEIHQNKIKKNKKEEKAERRPFSRETDLQVNRFDEAQKKAVLKKAQLLDDRFSSGQSKFL